MKIPAEGRVGNHGEQPREIRFGGQLGIVTPASGCKTVDPPQGTCIDGSDRG